MKPLAPETVNAYWRRLNLDGNPVAAHAGCLRWVRFYLDFCEKYDFRGRLSESMAPFLEKIVHQPEIPQDTGNEEG